MNTYTIHDENGDIVSYFVGNQSDLMLNLQDGFGYLEGEYPADQYKVIDGVASIRPEDDRQEPIDEVWADLKNQRNILLQSSDWTQVPDAPVDQVAWATYRQELRDLPDNTTDPRNPTWPTKPN